MSRGYGRGYSGLSRVSDRAGEYAQAATAASYALDGALGAIANAQLPANPFIAAGRGRRQGYGRSAEETLQIRLDSIRRDANGDLRVALENSLNGAFYSVHDSELVDAYMTDLAHGAADPESLRIAKAQALHFYIQDRKDFPKGFEFMWRQVSRNQESFKQIINADSGYGNALEAALQYGHKDIVGRLIDAGAEFRLESLWDEELLAGVLARRPAAAEQLKAGPDTTGRTVLHRAAESGNLALLRACLACDGIDVEAVDQQGQTALCLAVQTGKYAVVDALMDFEDINVDVKSATGTPLLHIAVSRGQVEIVRRLLDAANVNVTNVVGDTALHVAAKSESCAVAGLLLENGAAVGLKNKAGDTALHVAVTRGDLRMISVLLRSGADIQVKNNAGLSPLDLAVNARNMDVTQLLLGLRQLQDAAVELPINAAPAHVGAGAGGAGAGAHERQRQQVAPANLESGDAAIGNDPRQQQLAKIAAAVRLPESRFLDELPLGNTGQAIRAMPSLFGGLSQYLPKAVQRHSKTLDMIRDVKSLSQDGVEELTGNQVANLATHVQRHTRREGRFFRLDKASDRAVVQIIAKLLPMIAAYRAAATLKNEVRQDLAQLLNAERGTPAREMGEDILRQYQLPQEVALDAAEVKRFLGEAGCAYLNMLLTAEVLDMDQALPRAINNQLQALKEELGVKPALETVCENNTGAVGLR